MSCFFMEESLKFKQRKKAKIITFLKVIFVVKGLNRCAFFASLVIWRFVATAPPRHIRRPLTTWRPSTTWRRSKSAWWKHSLTKRETSSRSCMKSFVSLTRTKTDWTPVFSRRKRTWTSRRIVFSSWCRKHGRQCLRNWRTPLVISRLLLLCFTFGRFGWVLKLEDFWSVSFSIIFFNFLKLLNVQCKLKFCYAYYYENLKWLI